VNRSCLRLIGVSTAEANPMVLQDFDVGIAGTYLFYPAVTVDSSGNLFVAYTISAADQYASAAWAGLFVGPNVLLRNSIIESGVGVYGGNQTPERWGDYSAAARDPVDPTRVWLAAEYAAAPTATDLYNWGTGIGEVRLPRTYLPLVGGGG
jgi:hypothetical protein